jgi:hypothetical protein
MSDDVEDPVEARFRAGFPIRAGAVTLEYAGATYESYQSLVVLKLAVGGEVREEKVAFSQHAYDTERVAAFLTALGRVLGRAGPAAFAQCKPSDLFQFTVLDGPATTPEDFEVELLDVLGWLLAGGAPPSVVLGRLEEVCREVFPLKAENDLGSLDFVGFTLVGPSLRIVLRLVVWEEDPATGTRSIRDVKEQEVYFGALASHDPARTRALLEGMQAVLARVLATPQVETLMPHDLFRGDVLKLKTATTADDFARALSARSRLGKLLAPGERVAAPTPPLATSAELAALCREMFPMRTSDGAATLELVDATTDGTNLAIVLRLSRDGRVDEEACGLMVAGAYDRGRIQALLAATRTTFAGLSAAKLARARPSDLLVSALLGRRNTTTEADFARALRTKSRLGRFTS